MKAKIFFFLILIFFLLFQFSCASVQNKSFESANSEEEQLYDNENTESSASNTAEDAEEIEEDALQLQNIENRFFAKESFPGLLFDRPLDIQNAKDGTSRLFIVEQGGRIFVINNNDKPELFLDLSEKIDAGGNEKGLLGLAFHPDFLKNGLFFVNYTGSDKTIISSFTTSKGNKNIADPLSEEIILSFSQPYSNHNGGKIVFGLDDGYLYIASGDGGGSGDPQGNAQNLGSLLGKILRINIDYKEAGLNYSIPPDNPFKGNEKGYREEIYAYGLRNPWRFSFDSATNKLWAADVGQGKMEEINIIEKGKNYGWNIMEGSLCYNPSEGCNTDGLELPVYEYDHSMGRSITGGYVYHGNLLPLLKDIYIYADFISGNIWGLSNIGSNTLQNHLLADTGLNISSFGIGEDEELYFTAFDGKIYQLYLLQ